MQLREPFVRKHVHRWALVHDDKDFLSNCRYVTRKCDDCDAREKASLHSDELAFQTPDSLVHLADCEWRAL